MGILKTGLLALGLAAIAALATAVDGYAASAVCRQLEAQLANAGTRGGAARANSLVGRQKQELRKAKGQLRAAGCGFFSVGGQCSSLRSIVSRMERNLENLQGRAGGGTRSRGQIMAALNANDCGRGSTQRQMMARSDDRTSLLSAFFGDYRRPPPSTRRPWGFSEDGMRREFRDRSGAERDTDSRAARDGVGAVFGGRSFQAMCVRTSDGYYFPVSPSSYRSDLKRDRNNCQAMCPGADVAIYYKRLEDDESDGMISATNGATYGSLPTAYQYRDKPPVGCSGDRRTAMLAAAQSQATTVDFEFPVPSPKPGSVDTIPLWSGSADTVVATPAPGERSVRVVGPIYLPDPPAAGVLPVPVPTPVP